MNDYLAIRLQGVMQAWGGHTYEDLRHTELIPTRSALLGLLAACLGIDRKDIAAQETLSSGLRIAVRMDKVSADQHGKKTRKEPIRIMDFHTVMDARKVDGKANKHPVVSRREYWCDTQYTVLLQEKKQTVFSLKLIETALKKPVYTPFLGRRACALSAPLSHGMLNAMGFKQAFDLLAPHAGVIYSEEKLHDNDTLTRVRDEPVYARQRQFASRTLYIHATPTGGDHVSK